jgi:broad specificity phosphatase PhoE
MATGQIVLVRHGRPDIEVGMSASRWRLSQSGRNAVALLADRLRRFDFRKVASSPYAKALETAEAIALHRGLTVEVDVDLSEHARHSTEFLSRADFEEAVARLFNSPHDLVFGDETANDAFERFTRALDRQCPASDGADIVAVTHGTIMSIYVSRRLGIDPLLFWRALAMPTAIVLCGNELEIIEVQGAARR